MSNKWGALSYTVVVAVFVGGFIIDGKKNKSQALDTSTATCDNTEIIKMAKQATEESSSPLLGKVSILDASHFRQNPFFGRPAFDFMKASSMSQDQIQIELLANHKMQCAADMVTPHGEMIMYYGWRMINGQFYVEINAVPVL
jgi:hypothetical protein